MQTLGPTTTTLATLLGIILYLNREHIVLLDFFGDASFRDAELYTVRPACLRAVSRDDSVVIDCD